MAKVKFGLSNLKVFPRENNGTVTYKEGIAIPGAVSLTLEKEVSEAIFYADNTVYYSNKLSNGFTGEMEVADLPKEVMLALLDYAEATEGGILQTNKAGVPCALGFSVDTDEAARKFMLYNVTLSETSEEFATKEDEVEPTTSKLEFRCIGEVAKDGTTTVFKHVCNKGDKNYETFLTTAPTIPTVKVVGAVG